MDGLREFLNRPFSPEMNAGRWFLFFGLLIVISIAWGIILRAIAQITPD